MSLLSVIQANRPNICLSTVKNYISVLSSICKRQDIAPKDITIEKTVADLTKDKNSNRTKLSAVLAYVDDGKHNEFCIELRDRIRKIKDNIDDDRYNNEHHTTEKEKENLIPYEDVLKKYTELKKQITYVFHENAILSKAFFKLVQMYVLLSCYLLIPPRRSKDFTEFKIRNVDESKDNYMETGRLSYFVFQQYKTAKTYGKQKVEIPRELKHIIMKWKTINNSDYLLTGTTSGNQINPSTITHMLNNFFGKCISSSALRKIFITFQDKNGKLNSYGKMKKLAKEMGHSVEQQDQEYIKEIPK